MKVNDLRVNSWYNSVKFEQPVKCTLSDFAELYRLCEGAELDSDVISEMFEPIELTEEWLRKFGFKPLCKDFQLNGIIIHTRKRGYVLKKSVPIVKYVHQLQGLYFALTGQELTIK